MPAQRVRLRSQETDTLQDFQSVGNHRHRRGSRTCPRRHGHPHALTLALALGGLGNVSGLVGRDVDGDVEHGVRLSDGSVLGGGIEGNYLCSFHASSIHHSTYSATPTANFPGPTTPEETEGGQGLGTGLPSLGCGHSTPRTATANRPLIDCAKTKQSV